MYARSPAAALLALLPLGCLTPVDTDEQTGLFAGQDEGSVIIGSVGWRDITLLEEGSAERVNSRAVGYLSIPARGQRCTAFLIAPDVVMTNEHCIPGDWAAEGATVSFRRESGVARSQQSTWDCSVFLGNDPGLDFALLQCPERPGDVVGVARLEARYAQSYDPLYVIHQNCDYYASPGCDPVKRLSPGKVTRVSQEVGHDADTLGGSSGAPVFSSESHAVFALHHVGVGGQGNGRGVENRAVPMRDILPVLAERFPWLELAGPDGGAGADDDADVGGDDDGDAVQASYEPNDSAAEAPFVALPFDASLSIAGGDDRDLFLFDTSGGERSVRIDFQHQEGDLDLYLWRSDGALVAQSTSTSDTEELLLTLGAGRYFVDVQGYAGATGTYTLELR